MDNYDFILECVEPSHCSFGKFTKGKHYKCRVFDVIESLVKDDEGQLVVLDYIDGFKLV